MCFQTYISYAKRPYIDLGNESLPDIYKSPTMNETYIFPLRLVGMKMSVFEKMS